VDTATQGVETLPPGFEVENADAVASKDLPEGFELESSSKLSAKPKTLIDDAFKKGYEMGGRVTAMLAPGVGSVPSTLIPDKVAESIGRVSVPLSASILSAQTAGGVATRAIPALARGGFGPSVIKGGIEGLAGTIPLTRGSIEERMKQTGVGTAFGAGVGGAIQKLAPVAVKAGRALSKVYKAFKDPRIPLMSQIKDEIAIVREQTQNISSAARMQMSSSERAGRETSEAITGRAKEIESSIKSGASEAQRQVRQSIKITEREVGNAVDNLDNQLSKESDVAALSFQNQVTRFFRKNSSRYGQELNAISDEIAQTGRMTRGEALEVLERTIQKASSDAEITGGQTLARIRQLIDSKYSSQSVIPATGPGETATIVNRNLAEQVSFKQFLGEVRDIWKQIKPYKSGARFSADEIPAAILQSEFGEFVASLSDEFKGLQSAYRPVISYMNKANSIIQPYKGEAYRKGAYELVKRVAYGDAAPVEKDIVNFLEQGTQRFGKGVGNITGKARQIGENIKTLKTEMINAGMRGEAKILEIAEETAKKLSRIDTASRSSLNTVEQETMKRSGMIMEEAARQEMMLARRMKSLEKGSKNVEKLLQRRALIRWITGGIGLTLSGIGGLYGIYRAATGISKLGTIPE